jgi:hypothetical protein
VISVKGSVLRARLALVDELAPGDGRPGGVHRGFLVPGDPQAFLAKTPLIYSYYYDQGRRDYQRTGDEEAVLTTRDAETFSAPDCLTVVGWYRRALEMSGARSPKVVEEECRARGARCAGTG